VETILEKLESQCATEAALIADRVDLEQALTTLFTHLSALKSEERVKKLALLVGQLPPKERELARSIGQAMSSEINVRESEPSHAQPSQELEGFPVLNLLPPSPSPNLYRRSTSSLLPLRITNALHESSDRISLSASQAGLAGTDPEFIRTLQQ
jgi:hypothetical protein